VHLVHRGAARAAQVATVPTTSCRFTDIWSIIMKIQVVKKSGVKNPSSSQCTWFIEGLPEPRK
jgi:hypothetical protein